MQRASITALAMIAALLTQTPAAQACACCSEAGQRLETTDKIDGYVLGELGRIRFAQTAVLYSDAGFPDTIEGIASPSPDPYRVRAAIRGTIGFDLYDPAGRRGRVLFRLPSVISRFEVDPRGGGATPPNGPGLYKEWRLSGPAQLSGIATGGTAVATLILHGGGNSCTSSYDFTDWTLAVKGKGVSFTFLGKLVR